MKQSILKEEILLKITDSMRLRKKLESFFPCSERTMFNYLNTIKSSPESPLLNINALAIIATELNLNVCDLIEEI